MSAGRWSMILAAALMAAVGTGEADAQWRAGGVSDLDLGPRALDPVRATERALVAECGRDTALGPDARTRADFTGDGVADVILRVESPCRGFNSYFCGSRGCRTDLWVRERDGAFRLVETFVANEVAVIPWYDGPAVQIDRGPVWVWDRDRLTPADEAGQTVDEGWGPPDDDIGAAEPEPEPEPAPAPQRRSDRLEDIIAGVLLGDRRRRQAPPPPSRSDAGSGGWTNPDDAGAVVEAEAPPEPGVWRVEGRDAGGVRAMVDGTDGSQIRLACAPGDDALRLAIRPTAGSGDGLPATRSPSYLIELLVDRRVIETRLMRRPRAGGALVEPAVASRGALAEAMRRGSRVSARDAGSGETLAEARLRGSSRAIQAIRSACGL